MKLHFDEFGFGGRESADTMLVPASAAPALDNVRAPASEVRIRVDLRPGVVRRRVKAVA